jgi:hypothetical protein
LNAARTGGRSLAGLRAGDDLAKHDVIGRTVVDDQDTTEQSEKKSVINTKAALLGTVNMLAKFDAGGVNLIDSALSETGGNVGIGATVLPSSGLYQEKHGDSSRVRLRSYGGLGILFGERASGSLAAPAALTAGSQIFFFGAGGFDGTAFKSNATAGLRVFAAQNWSPTGHGSYLTLETTANGATSNTERMRITDAGNVGSGTTTPSERLHVGQNGNYQLRLENPASGGGFWNIGQSDNTFNIGGGKLAFVPDTTNSSAATVVFTNNGNIGIGTTEPDARLHVVDDTPATDAGVIHGETTSSANFAYAVVGEGNQTSAGANSTAVRGIHRGTTAFGIGVWGSHAGSGAGVFGTSGVGGFAGLFSGNVDVLGSLTKSSGAFKIDHPLDPENKYLYHSFVESPDMKNIYDGVATLDANGVAEVELPDWFGALNDKFRYQLTAIDAPGPNLYIAQKVANNRFKVAGGLPGLEVSWQVTGIRQDAFANKHRIPVEELKKPEEQGTYLHPEAFGQPAERGTDATFMRRAEAQTKADRAREAQEAKPQAKTAPRREGERQP